MTEDENRLMGALAILLIAQGHRAVCEENKVSRPVLISKAQKILDAINAMDEGDLTNATVN